MYFIDQTTVTGIYGIKISLHIYFSNFLAHLKLNQEHNMSNHENNYESVGTINTTPILEKKCASNISANQTYDWWKFNKCATNEQNQHTSSTAPPSAELEGLVCDNFDLLTDFLFLICTDCPCTVMLTLIMVLWWPPGLTTFDLFGSIDSHPSIEANSTELLLYYCDPAGQAFSFRRDQKCFLKTKRKNLILFKSIYLN